MSKQVLKLLDNVKPGDLIAVDWCDASVGKSSGSGLSIDVPVKSALEHLIVKRTVIDYGSILILAGGKVHVELLNENIDVDFRVNSAEYSVEGETQELAITLELGRDAVLLADYLYALKSKVNKVNKLKIAQ